MATSVLHLVSWLVANYRQSVTGEKIQGLVGLSKQTSSFEGKVHWIKV